MYLIHSIQLQKTNSMLLLNMRSWVFLIFFILLSLSNSHALELFGYKLYDGIDQYINDGEVNFKKKLIEEIEIDSDKVLIANQYLSNYFIRSTKTGYIFEIHGSNNNLKINPVECLDIQDEFIASFQNKIPSLFSTQIKQFPNKLKSKTTWEIYMNNESDNSKLIFSVTCDYSFNNRRMDIILSDEDYRKNEDYIFENLEEVEKEKIKKKEIDTTGI